MPNYFEPGGHPINYFGKGEQFVLPDDKAICQEFTDRFDAYETAHPDDPTGEVAWGLEKSTQKTIPKRVYNPNPTEGKKELELDTSNQDWADLQITLPARYVELLKNYSRFMRRRPRDVVMLWIDQHCKL